MEERTSHEMPKVLPLLTKEAPSPQALSNC